MAGKVIYLFYLFLVMYKSKSCLYRPQTLKDYVRHYRLHTNIANITFPCAIQDCARHFRTYGAFKSHVARDHQHIKVQRSQVLEVNDLATLETQCPFTFCAKISKNLKDLLQDLKTHIIQGNEVQCIFEGCRSTFRIKSSFSFHVARKHKQESNRLVSSNLILQLEIHACSNPSPLRACNYIFGIT